MNHLCKYCCALTRKMYLCSNQYNCQSVSEQILSTIARLILNAKNRRRLLKFLTKYGFVNFWIKYEHIVYCLILVYVFRKVPPFLFKTINNFFLPCIDVEGDNAPFEEIELEPNNDEDDYYDRCPICFENFINNTAILENCNHIYHPKCIKKWYNNCYGECPICRQVSDLYYIHTYPVRNPILKQMIFNAHKDKLGPRVVKPKNDELNVEERQMLERFIDELIEAESEQNSDSEYSN